MKEKIFTPGKVCFAFFVYLTMSIVFFGSSLAWSSAYLGKLDDPIQFMWFLNWWVFAPLHGLNPFWSHFVWFPNGFDFAWATSVPLLAILAAPLTLAKNAVVSYDVLSILAPPLAAISAFLLIRAVVRDSAAAFVGGMIFGFSSYEIAQLRAHLNLDFTCLVPLLVLCAVLRFQGRLSRVWFVILTGVGLALEMGISSEIVATICTLGAVVWGIFFAFGEPSGRGRLGGLARDLIYAGVLAAVLSLPLLYYLVLGSSTVPAAIQSIPAFSADPLNFLLPTRVTWLGHAAAAPLMRHIRGNAFEQGAYLGLPLILIVIAYARGNWHRCLVRALVLSIVVLAVLSLGPILHIDGRDTGIPLPWIVMLALPLIKSALPVRFTLYVALAVAIAVSAWIAEARGGIRVARLALAIVGYVFLLPNQAAYAWSTMPAPLGRAIKPGANILVLPFASQGPGMAWQLEDHMRFTQSGGYVGFMPASEWGWPVIREFVAGKPRGDFHAALVEYCATHRVQDLVLGPGTAVPLVRAIGSLHWPSTRYGDVLVVQVPKARHYLVVRGDYWPSRTSRFGWVGRTATIMTQGRPARLVISGSRRPPSLPPVTIDVFVDGRGRAYRVGQRTKITIDLPVNSTTTLRADRIFRPKDVEHDRDYRHLSVGIAVTQVDQSRP